MIEFTHTCTNPKAVMIILPHALTTVIAVLGPVWRFHGTELTELLFGQFNLCNVLNRLHLIVSGGHLFIGSI